MEDLLWNSSWSNEEDSGSEESLFVSDVPGRCSSPPLQELQTVARILGLPEIDTRTPEIRVEKLAKDSNVFEREKSCPVEVTTGGVLFEVLENDQGLNLYKLCSHLILLFFSFLFLFFLFFFLVGTCCIDY